MRSISMRSISREFCRQMDIHNLEGTLTPNYRLTMLDVNVRPKTSSGSNLVETSLSSLSGGERSKTLVCLINSLWYMQQPPVRCLDEWDVFLDAVARKQIEAMLVKTAVDSEHQYFFISPQGSMFADTPKREWKHLSEKMKKSIQVFTVRK